MALNIGVKSEGKLTCAFKNDMRNFANSYQSMFESLKIRTFIGSFYPKQKMCELKVYRGVMCHAYFMMLESDAKFEEKVTCGLENDMKNLANFHQSTQKS